MTRATTLILLAAALFCVSAQSAYADSRLGDRMEEVSSQLDSLDEDFEDLEKDMSEFTLFDECMFLIGVDKTAGYWYGENSRRSALDYDLDGPDLPFFELLAFPAEEPPGIECNEDAEPENKDDN